MIIYIMRINFGFCNVWDLTWYCIKDIYMEIIITLVSSQKYIHCVPTTWCFFYWTP